VIQNYARFIFKLYFQGTMRQNGQKYGPPCPFTKDDTTTHSLSLSTLVILARLLVQEKEYKTSPEQMCRSIAIPWCIPCIPKNCCANNVTVYPTVSFGRLLTMKGDTRIGTANTVLRACIALWSQNGSFQKPQSCQFVNRSLFRSSPMVMNPG